VIADERPSAQRTTEDADLLRELQRAVEEDLTPHQRDVFVALALNEVPIDVLSERLDTTRGALYKTLLAPSCGACLRRRATSTRRSDERAQREARGTARPGTWSWSSEAPTQTSACPECERTSRAAPRAPPSTTAWASCSRAEPRGSCYTRNPRFCRPGSGWRMMSGERPDRDEAERAMRRLLREHDLPEPDDILDHEDGIVCLWHEPKVAIIVELEPRAA
jgi:hypothetical protein